MAIPGDTLVSLRSVNSDTYTSPKFLDYYQKTDVWQMFGKIIQFPKNSGKTITVKGYNPPPTVTNPLPLAEGVPPAPRNMSIREVQTNVVQYGDYLRFTDELMNYYEDANNLNDEQNEYLVTLQAEGRGYLTFNMLLGGSNVIYSNGSARTSVNTPLSIGVLHRASRVLKNGASGRGAKPITRMLSSSASWGTVDIEPAYIAIISPHLEYDVRSLPGFAPVSAYGNSSARIHEMEFGKVDNFRFITTTLYYSFADGGGAVGSTNTKSTSAAQSDVYPILIFGQDAYAIIPVAGMEGMTMIRKPLGSSGSTDPLNQAGTVGFKYPYASMILYQERMVRVEVACTDVPGL